MVSLVKRLSSLSETRDGIAIGFGRVPVQIWFGFSYRRLFVVFSSSTLALPFRGCVFKFLFIVAISG